MKSLWYLLCMAVSLCSSPAIAEDVVATIPAGTGPRAVAVNPRTNLIYVIDGGANGPVQAISGVTGQIIAIQVGSAPVALGVNPRTNRIYVANQFGMSISVIDGETNQLEATVSSGTAVPVGIAVDARRNLVYVLNGDFHASVIVLDGDTNEIAASIPFSVADCVNPVAIALNQKTDTIYVACPAAAPSGLGGPAHNMIVIDGRTRTASVVDVGDFGSGGPVSLAVNPKTNLIYLLGQGSQGCAASGIFFCVVLRTVDGQTNTVLQSFEFGVSNGGFLAVAINPRTDRVYVVNSSSPTLTVFDAENNVVFGEVPVGQFPVAVAVNTRTNLVYVANAQSNTLSVIAGPDAHQ